VQRFQYTEAFIRRILWDEICSQFLLALVFVLLAAGIDSLVSGKKWVRSAFIGVFTVGGVLPVMCWWSWRGQRKALQSTVIEIGEQEIGYSMSEGWLLGPIRQESILISEVGAVWDGPHGFTLFGANLKRGILLPRGTAQSDAVVEEFLRRLPSGVFQQQQAFSWIGLSAVFGLYCFHLVIFYLIGSSIVTDAVTSAILMGPVASAVLGPTVGRLREKIWPLSFEREAQI
jgi:hypothetical protein